MSAIVILTSNEGAKPLIEWSLRFSQTRSHKLKILYVEKPDAAESKEVTIPKIETILKEINLKLPIDQISGPLPERAILSYINSNKTQLVIAGVNYEQGAAGTETQLGDILLQRVPCDLILLDAAKQDPNQCKNIILPVGGKKVEKVLRFGNRLAKGLKGILTPLRTQQDVGGESYEIGKRELDNRMERAGLKDIERIHPKVEMAERNADGIKKVTGEHDLVLLNVTGRYLMRELRISDEKGGKAVFQNTAIAIYRSREIHSDFGLRAFVNRLLRWLPQMDFADRVTLFESLHKQSKWNIDFVFMMALSSGIASLGLLQNSPAVIIGGMLVAPLMTPLIASGLALVQENQALMVRSGKAVVLGFLVALGTSFLFGLLNPFTELTHEIYARGNPNSLDLVIAFFSGVAAAYAFARPSLVGAIAGVAVAAALVPPISTVGITLADGNFAIAEGAAMLFGTNLVAIILGAALVFAGLGIKSRDLKKRTMPWSRAIIIGLTVAFIVLSIPLLGYLIQEVAQGRHLRAGIYVVPPRVEKAIEKKVAENSDVSLLFAGQVLKSGKEEYDIVVFLGAEKDISESFGDELIHTIRNHSDPNAHVEIVCLEKTWIKKSGQEKHHGFFDWFRETALLFD